MPEITITIAPKIEKKGLNPSLTNYGFLLISVIPKSPDEAKMKI